MAVIGEITKATITSYVDAAKLKQAAGAVAKELPAFLAVAPAVEPSSEGSADEGVAEVAEVAPKKARGKSAEAAE